MMKFITGPRVNRICYYNAELDTSPCLPDQLSTKQHPENSAGRISPGWCGRRRCKGVRAARLARQKDCGGDGRK